MTENELIEGLLTHTDKNKLRKFIKEYAAKNDDFKKALIETFLPKQKSATAREKQSEDYEKIIHAAFVGKSRGRSNRYRDYYDDFGFDAVEVREKLEPLLEKARFFAGHNDVDEAVHIAQKLIEAIPDEWDENFDYEGDVQVIYDEAIDFLEELLEKRTLSKELKEALFAWYEKEIKDKKHEYVGLNTSLETLEDYFVDDVEGGRERVLKLINNRIATGADYEKERAVKEKYYLLQEHDSDEAEKVLKQYLHFPEIRMIKLKQLLNGKLYAEAINLINEGIEVATQKGHSGTAKSWMEELLSVYQLQNDKEKVRETAKKLFAEGSTTREYYKLIKQLTPKNEWNAELTWILSKLNDRGYYSANELKAEIYIEHEMWEDLWRICQKSGVSSISKYEKHLRPQFDTQIYTEYLSYIQHQATITDKDAYKNVADYLIKLKSFAGGTQTVDKLVAEYREKYKRRVYMMKELERV